MESFKINTTDAGKEVLVIPDDCTSQSIFHLVKDGSEYCKLVYTDDKQWELMENAELEPAELRELARQIEEHYLTR